MCWYKTSSSLNPTASSQAAHLLLGHFAFRSTSQLQLKGSETTTHTCGYEFTQKHRNTHMWRQTHTAEAKAHAQKHTNAYYTRIFTQEGKSATAQKHMQMHTHTEKHTNTHTDTQNDNCSTTTHTHTVSPPCGVSESNVLSFSALSSSLLISQQRGVDW